MNNEEKTTYKYFLLKNQYLVRAKLGNSDLSPKEFFIDGDWKSNHSLDISFNDCLMDYGDSKWYEITDITEAEVLEIIKNKIKK